ncbi:ATP-dependent RecD-like DNA helicase [Vibrio sp. 10N.247.311.14]|uniref:ATP-dependent DNA helicase n=1 Tax=Vibrio sp. 10N.247.311.14 TaxID=3229994 RepID=UPI0035526770
MTKKPTNRKYTTEQFRLTSFFIKTSSYMVLKGVPIARDSYKKNDGKYIVSLGINPTDLPVKPSIGQHWEVNGIRDITKVTQDDYVMDDYRYSNATLKCLMPNSSEAFVRFIAKQKDFKDVGEIKARRLWARFQKRIYTLLSEDTEQHRLELSEELTPAAIDAMYLGYEKYANLKSANWMSEHNIPYDVQQRLFKSHGRASIDAIKLDPYRLMTFGLGFNETDALAMERFSIVRTDERRLIAAVEAAMQKEVSKGHTCADKPTLRKAINSILKDANLTSLALKLGEDKTRFAFNSETMTYHPTGQLLMEAVVARRLVALSNVNNLYTEEANAAFVKAKNELPYELTQRQCEAVIYSLDNAVACITGGAGTGKTTVLRTALRSFYELGYTIHALALSGRAAMRLHESIGFGTKTIAAFLRDETITESRQLVVVDEASMVDLPLMYRIITHIAPNVRILLVGDPNQLPPIGAGRILADVIASGVIINTTLDIVKRQEGSSGIPEYSRLVNNGVVPQNLSSGAISFHEAEDQDSLAEICQELYAGSPDNSRIMAPTNRLVDRVNELVQWRINRTGEPIMFSDGLDEWYTKMRKGDQVLFTKNDHIRGVQNGLLGELTDIERTESRLGVITLDNGKTLDVDNLIIDQLRLGYAITLHKAQGSQFPRVIIALQNSKMLDRAWLYTAITRAEAEVHIVGTKDLMGRVIIAPSHTSLRNTYLPILLNKYKSKNTCRLI